MNWRVVMRVSFLISLLLGSVEAGEVKVVRDLDYVGGGNPRQTLDLILPAKKSESPRPVLVFIHGGGWSKGHKGAGHVVLPPLVRQGGFAGVTINYRLSQEAIWPAQIHDCKAAVRWVRAHAKEYGFDPSRIAVLGLSAGGHLAALIGGTGVDKALEGTLGKHLDQPSAVTCVVDYFGPTHFVTLDEERKLLPMKGANSPVARLFGPDPARRLRGAREASPTSHVSAGDPPILIAHGNKDRLVPFQMSVSYAALLAEAKVSNVLIEMQGGGHGFRRPALERRVFLFLQKHLRGWEVRISDAPIRVGG
jgi:acetyl esterase/lipase